MNKTIYTHDEAALIVDAFEELLIEHGICVPSPEDDERGEENMIGLYGSTYYDLIDYIENNICSVLERQKAGEAIVEGVFSGNI